HPHKCGIHPRTSLEVDDEIANPICYRAFNEVLNNRTLEESSSSLRPDPNIRLEEFGKDWGRAFH
ncbi:MAG TPA: hypothetical protein DIV46_01395, partial [Verrucomicrobiales bacterium]|nr:hypothetical protein [Verrucomicrobiales bacterium]